MNHTVAVRHCGGRQLGLSQCHQAAMRRPAHHPEIIEPVVDRRPAHAPAARRYSVLGNRDGRDMVPQVILVWGDREPRRANRSIRGRLTPRRQILKQNSTRRRDAHDASRSPTWHVLAAVQWQDDKPGPAWRKISYCYDRPLGRSFQGELRQVTQIPRFLRYLLQGVRQYPDLRVGLLPHDRWHRLG